MAASWLTPAEAAAMMKVSVRTLRRKIQRGEVAARTSDNGRQEVRVDTMAANGGQVAVNESHLATINTGLANRLADHADMEIARFEQTCRRVEHDLTRSRRIGAMGWVLVFVLLAGGIGAAWKGARILAQAESQAETARVRAETLQADLSIARTEKDAVRVSLATITDALQEQTAATREKSAEVLTLRAELAQARTTAGRATWFRQVLGAFYQAGQVTTRPSQ